MTQVASTDARLKTPRAAAIAGIIFSVLLMVSLALVRSAIPADPKDLGEWLESDWDAVRLALNLLPFSGIAFLWFIGVVRDRLGPLEDRFIATVFLGSGILFLAMLFSSAAVAGGTLRVYGTAADLLSDPSIYIYGRTVTYEIMNVYAMKMAGVFMISTCTLSLRTGIVPRWMAYLGLALALFLLLSMGYFEWAPAVFPLWVLLLSLYILLANMRSGAAPG